MDFLTTHAITLDLDAQYCLVGGVRVLFTGGEDNIGVVGYLEPATSRDDCGGLLRNPEDRSAGPLGRGDTIKSEVYMTELVSHPDMRLIQKRDTKIRQVRSALIGGKPTWPKGIKKLRRYCPRLEMRDGLVSYRKGSRLVPVVTRDVLVELALAIHFSQAHLGREKLIDALTDHVWHPEAANVAADITRSCDHCQCIPTRVPSVFICPLYKKGTDCKRRSYMTKSRKYNSSNLGAIY